MLTSGGRVTKLWISAVGVLCWLQLLSVPHVGGSAALRHAKHKHDENIAILEGYLDIDSTSSSNSSSPDSFLVNMVRF
jgi:hypothetical protein